MDHEYGIDQTCHRCGMTFADVAKYQLVCLPPPDEDCDTPLIVDEPVSVQESSP